VAEPANGGSTDETFTVTLSSPDANNDPNNPISVDFATSDGTAIDGTDYAGASGTLTFQPGQTTQTFTVTVFGTGDPEGTTKTFNIALSNPFFTVLGNPNSTTVTITNNGGSGSGGCSLQSMGSGSSGSLALLVPLFALAGLWVARRRTV
jgi:MYXO-CTERM domain-containing protein